MGMLASLFSVLAIGAAVWIGFAWLAQRSLLFPRPPVPSFDTARSVPGVEKLRLGEDRVEAWLLAPEGVDEPAPALIFTHGNGELIDYWVEEFQVPRDWGMAVLLVEYPGYGRSGGSPSQDSITRVLVEAYDALVARDSVDGARVVGYGRSIGGAAMCQLVARREIAALVLESTFTSVVAMARRFGIPSRVIRDPFDSLAALRDFGRPSLLIHGTRDEIVPFVHAEALAAALADSRLHSIACGHNDCPRAWPVVRGFLEEAGILRD